MQTSYSYHSVEELDEIAAELLKQIDDRFRVWLFSGEMGMGKTTLIKAICRKLGVLDEVQSPTYSIVNEYVISDSFQHVYHFDLFRLNSFDEVLDLGFWEYIDSGNYCFIEWPDLVIEHLDLPYIKVNITSNGVTCRSLQLSLNEFP